MVARILSRAAQSAVKRADDNEATIKNRIHTFRTNTEAILCQYGDKVKRVSDTEVTLMCYGILRCDSNFNTLPFVDSRGSCCG